MIHGSVVLMPAGCDMFASGAEALVSPVDCTGAQGKGLALAVKRRWPRSTEDYKRHAQTGVMRPGMVWSAPRSAFWLFFVATKLHWRNPSRLAWVETGLTNLRYAVVEHGIRSIGIPALGCGEGGLAWSDVRPLLMAAGERMADGGVRVTVYAPHETVQRR